MFVKENPDIKKKKKNYCLVTCTEHPVNIISSTVRTSIVSYRTACPVGFDVQTVNVTLLCTYCCFLQNTSSHYSHFHFLELPLHSGRLPTRLSLLITISLITMSPINTISQKYHSHQHCHHHCFYHHHLHHHPSQLCSYYHHHHHHHHCHHYYDPSHFTIIVIITITIQRVSLLQLLL